MFRAVTFAASIAAASALAITTSSVPTGPPMGVYQTDAAVPAVTATTVVPVSTATGVAKRDVVACLAQPTGIAHISVPDTAEGFLADAYYSAAALAAGTPSGFTSVFANTNASPNADSYMGFTLLQSYDVQSCASKCSAISGCKSFNIYFERDPSVDPNDASCLDPSSVTQIKCVWWGSVISPSVNVNNGQWRGNFHVVIAGSNGYTTGDSTSTSASASASTSTSASASTSTLTSASASTSTSSAKSSSTTMATSTVRTTSSTASASAASSPFNIKVDWTGTSADGKFLSVSSSGVVSMVSQASASKFIYDANNNLVNVATGLLANVPQHSGKWQVAQFSTANQGFMYTSCSYVAPYVQCSLDNVFEFAGICNNDGKLYFGLYAQMPKGCQWAGLFPVKV